MEDFEKQEFINWFVALIRTCSNKTKEEALKHAEVIWEEMDESNDQSEIIH